MYCILPIQAKKLWSSLGLEEFQHRWSRGERLNSIGDALIIGEHSNQLCALLSFLPPPPFPWFGRLVQPSGFSVRSFTQGIELCFLHKWKTKLVLVGAGSRVHWCFYLYEGLWTLRNMRTVEEFTYGSRVPNQNGMHSRSVLNMDSSQE